MKIKWGSFEFEVDAADLTGVILVGGLVVYLIIELLK